MAMTRSVSGMVAPIAPFASTSAGTTFCCSLPFSPLTSSFSGSRLRKERRPLDNPNGLGFDLYSFGSRSATSSRRDSYKSRVARPRASVEDGVKTSEAATSEETQASTSNSDTPTIESIPSSPPSPFASGKISKIAAKPNGDSKNSVSASIAQKAATPIKKPAAPKPPAVGQLSANAAAQLKVSRNPSVFNVPTKPSEGKPSSPFAKPTDGKPASPFTQAGTSKPTAPENPFRKTPFVPDDWEKAGARPAGSGKRVLDAFKEGEKEGNTTKFGLPLVPTNIFDEVRRTPEEIAADAFKFEISPGQLILAASFLVVIGIMFATVFLVWKVGAIHYNEY
ncbi:unnamed protein product [Calypogeia fissa]